MRFPKRLAVLGIAAAWLLTGCGSSITGVTVSLPETLERGDTAQATTAYTYDGATPEAAKEEELAEELGMHWTSSDPSVVAVSPDGTLLAVKAGTAEVALSSEDGAVQDSGVITVVVSPTGLSMVETLELQLGSNSTAQLQATVTPSDATWETIAYTSSDQSVATVAADGTVTSLAAGETDIRAELPGTGLAAQCHLTVLPAEEPEEEAPAEEPAAEEPAAQTETTPDSGTAEAPAASSGDSGSAATQSTAYGAVPFSEAAGTNMWYGITAPDPVFDAVLQNINTYRAAVGVAPLTMDANMTAIAGQRCEDMIVNMEMSHDGYQTAEIIAQNYNSAQSVVDAWAASPGHYAAMTDPGYTICGIGCVFEERGSTYWCVTLG